MANASSVSLLATTTDIAQQLSQNEEIICTIQERMERSRANLRDYEDTRRKELSRSREYLNSTEILYDLNILKKKKKKNRWIRILFCNGQ
jgi:vacuolar-type H+-ATPase subunit I/STV1